MSDRVKWIALLSILTLGCDSVTTEQVSQAWSFDSDFDSASILSDLFPGDLSVWTNVQCVEPTGTQSSAPSGLSVTSGANTIDLSTIRSVSGTKSLHFGAPPTGSSVSKAAIAKQGVDFKPGDRVTAQFKLYLTDNGSATNLFLMDFESMELSGYPGRRLAISGSQELMLESKGSGGAYGSGPNFSQPPGSKVALPKGQWVGIKVEILISRGAGGSAKIWQDGVLVLSASGMTFPAETDITHYNWVEFGATANSSPSTQSLWIDDVSITKN